MSFVDESDLKIIDSLVKNARISFKDLSKQLNISDVAVKKRIDKLVKEGYIRKFTVEVDNKKLGKGVCAFLLIKSEANHTKDLAEELSRLKGVDSVYTTMGEYEIILGVHVSGIDELRKLAEDKIAIMPGLIEVKTNIVFSEH
jgi:DNA-binding Lrp family transcriptional regulator